MTNTNINNKNYGAITPPDTYMVDRQDRFACVVKKLGNSKENPCKRGLSLTASCRLA